MTVSHVHCQVTNLAEAIRWFAERCGVEAGFNDGRMGVLQFGPFTLILDATSSESVATIGSNSTDCDADCAAMVARGATVLEPPQDRGYGARAAYIKGPGALKSRWSSCFQGRP